MGLPCGWVQDTFALFPPLWAALHVGTGFKVKALVFDPQGHTVYKRWCYIFDVLHMTKTLYLL